MFIKNKVMKYSLPTGSSGDWGKEEEWRE